VVRGHFRGRLFIKNNESFPHNRGGCVLILEKSRTTGGLKGVLETKCWVEKKIVSLDSAGNLRDILVKGSVLNTTTK